ncbi:amidohydrolase family protein [Paenibacillus aurantius]|uniref:Amidohydrolase family protein n=1 Tax=Paenibacillus aurantius TaxID=2918900 RepID=A0AA96RF58_9BACL|nr:amidohydrolase family protein [Paenibacillus aurantius]WNQ10918.1 amidohydrolase family protein [Paenibacillus aurantius]
MRIDAHQHFWKIDRGDYGWITPEIPVLYRDYLPEDLKPILDRHGIGGTIAVQAAPTLEETDYLLSLAEKHPAILGVVGWLDLNDPRWREHFERHRQHPRYIGFRIMIQEMPDARVILEPSFVEALRFFAEEDVPVDLLVKAGQLDSLVELLDRVPNVRGVIDHIAKPFISRGEMEPWLSQMRRIASHPGIYCKLSGMVTEADPESWKPSDLTGYIRSAIELFGPDRVMFGSDWPVCLLAASYDEVMEALEESLPDGYSEVDREKLFGGNAAVFYKLPPR